MKSERLELRVTPDWLAEVDEWRRRQHKIPTRNEAVRRLVQRALENDRESDSELERNSLAEAS
jgi:metal-responsive CopG/Arc/MetJ family transcriptional regulator